MASLRRRLQCTVLVAAATAAAATALLAPTAGAAPYSGLAHPCHYRFGVGEYQDVSYDGATSCTEAETLIANVTRDGRWTPRVGTRTGRTPHGTWRCTTVRRRETHGVIASTHRVTCRLTDDPRGRPARVRFFRES